MVETLAVQKNIHAVAAVKVVVTAMLFAILFAGMVKYMVIVGAFYCRTFSL
jgi:hypothetical protein